MSDKDNTISYCGQTKMTDNDNTILYYHYQSYSFDHSDSLFISFTEIILLYVPICYKEFSAADLLNVGMC